MSPLLFFAVIALTHSEWISHPDNKMPREDTMSAIGSYNDSIYLLGGSQKPRQKTTYDIKENAFVFYKSGFVPATSKISGEAQYWTQMGFKVYILDDLDAEDLKISVFNMVDNSFNPEWKIIPTSVSDGNGVACIASSSKFNKIFVNGGIFNSVSIKVTSILDIASMDWSIAPQMQIARSSHSCIIHPKNNFLYSIGGYSVEESTNTIEKVQITENIDENTQWTFADGTLIRATEGCRAFINGDYIVIISGYRNIINILDTTNHLVTEPDEPLAFPTSGYSAVIMVNNVMYSFGGGSGMDGWQSRGTLPSKETPSPTTINNPAPTSPITTKPDNSSGMWGTDALIKDPVSDNGGGGGLSPAAGDILLCLFILGLVCGVIIVAFIVNKRHEKNKNMKEFTQVGDNEDDKDLALVSEQGNNQYTPARPTPAKPLSKDDNEEKVDMVVRPQDMAHMNNDF